MNKGKGKVSPTAAAVATATVVATRTLTSSSTTTTMTSKDIPKVYPQTLDIPLTPSKATSAKPIPEGDKRSSTAVTSVSPKTAGSQPPPFVHSDNGSRGQNHQQQKSPAAIHPSQFASICREVAQIREEHVAIRKNLSEREGELGKTRVALRNIAQERDSLRNKVSELEHLLKHSPEMYSHVASMLSNGNGGGGMSTPIKSDKSSPLEKSSSKSSHTIIPSNGSNTSNEPVNYISSPRLTHKNIAHHQQNQNKLVGARPDAVFIPSTESPRKCYGSGSHLKKGVVTVGEVENASGSLVIVSSSSSSPPHVNSQESHQPNNNNKKLQQQKQLKHSIHNSNVVMSQEKSAYREQQENPFSEHHNGNARNENGNDIPTMTNRNNNNNTTTTGGRNTDGESIAEGGLGQQHHQHQYQYHHQQHYHLSQSGMTGLDLMLLGPDCSTKVVEHLVHPLAIESSVREIQHTLVLRGVPLNGDRLREVEIEIDRLNSRIDHLRSQNDMLTLNLEDAKSHADRLTELLGKYESNNVALQLALRYSDQISDAYEVLVALLETELGQMLANLHAAGQLHSICPPSSDTTMISGSGSGNNNNSNDNSPSELSPCLQSSSSSSPSATKNGTSPEQEGAKIIGKSGENSDNNNGMMMVLVKNHQQDQISSAAPTSPPSSAMNLMEQAKRNRLAAERAARFLLSRFSCASLEQVVVSPTGSHNNNFCKGEDGNGSHHHLQHHVPLSNLSCDSNNSSCSISASNLSNISGEGGQSFDEEQLSTIIAVEKEKIEADNGKNKSSSTSPTSSTIRGSFIPNGLNGCSSIIASLSPLLGRAFHSQPSTRGVEPRIRHLISNLKAERDAVKQTVMELESGSLESLSPSSKPSSPYNNNATWSPADARKMDLETAVLMQELMAMKEERAELRAQQFLLEKEKVSLELRLQSHESQEEAYKARINYLKSEIMDCKSLHSETYQQQERNRNDNINSQQQQQQQNHHQQQQQNQTENNGNNFRNSETLNNNNNNQNVNWEREVLLKKRIHELANTLEKVTVGSQVREKQNEEMINELNRANGILMQTLEVAKKKYLNRIKKTEDQILYVSERHAAQLKLFGERLPTITGKCHD